jgi:hypothetical protein
VPAAQIAQQPAGLDELDPAALPSCLVAKTFGQMRFADASIRRTTATNMCRENARTIRLAADRREAR